MSSVERYQAGVSRGLEVERRQVPLPVLRVVGMSAAVGAGVAWAGTALVLVVAELAVLVGWLMVICPALIAALVFGRAAVIELGARDQLRKRNARERSRAPEPVWSDEPQPVGPVAVDRCGPVWAHASRTQPALPRAERRLPQRAPRELGR